MNSRTGEDGGLATLHVTSIRFLFASASKRNLDVRNTVIVSPHHQYGTGTGGTVG